MIRRPPRSTHCISSAASDVYKRQLQLIAQCASRVARRIRALRLFAWEESVDRGLRLLRIIRPEFGLLAWRKTSLFSGYFFLGEICEDYLWLKTLVFRHGVLTPYRPTRGRAVSGSSRHCQLLLGTVQDVVGGMLRLAGSTNKQCLVVLQNPNPALAVSNRVIFQHVENPACCAQVTAR